MINSQVILDNCQFKYILIGNHATMRFKIVGLRNVSALLTETPKTVIEKAIMEELDKAPNQEGLPPGQLPVDDVSNIDDQKPIYNKFQVADVVKRERQRALDKGRQMAMDEMQQQQQQATANQPVSATPPVQQPQSLGGMTGMSPDQIRQMIAEESPRHLQAHLQQQAAQMQAESFVQKMKVAEAKYPGLEARLEKLDWTNMGPLVKLIDATPNPGDIMKELMDNPMKLGNLIATVHTQHNMAADAVRDLSNSISQNQKALSQDAQASPPLGQMTPSNIGSDTGVKGSVRDFKNKYRG